MAWLVAFCCVAAGPPLRVVMLSGSAEYDSAVSLRRLEERLKLAGPVSVVRLEAVGTTSLPGLEALAGADVAVLFTRRLTLPEAQLAHVRRYVASGKPIVAIRTASHGFQNWLGFDAEVLGGDYQGHLGKDTAARCRVASEAARRHPALAGVGTIASRGSLYKNPRLAADVNVLLEGSIPGASYPVAWTRESGGRRVFCTSLGHQEDFLSGAFLRMLTNAVHWAAGRPAPPPPTIDPPEPPSPMGALRIAVRRRPNGTERSETVTVPAGKLGLVVCDLWDRHWCAGATRRVDAMAPAVERLVSRLRPLGVAIAHAPSDVVDWYQDSPARRRLERFAGADARLPPLLPATACPPLPIDDADGGCDTGQASFLAWTRQHAGVTVADTDGVSDRGEEIRGYFAARGVTHVLLVGVHTNMCVLNRSFGLKAMRRWPVEPILVRDLTDTMYNPARPPRVPHDEGTRLVVEHIERHVAGSTTAAGIEAGATDGASR